MRLPGGRAYPRLCVAEQRRRHGLGEQFLAELEATIGKILLNPLRCGKISGVFRCCRTRRFPYGIIYAVEDDEIFVAAVAHTKRKPGYWKTRLGSGQDQSQRR